MKKIILITHGEVASSYKKTMETFFKPLHPIEAICLEPNDSLNDFKEKLDDLNLSYHEEYLVFADMISGTPYHVACVYFKEYQEAKIIYGLNLPMLFTATCNNSFDIDHIVSDGTKSIGVHV